jgi:hypothetical protein
MSVPIAATWVPTAVGIVVASGLLWVMVVWITARDDRPDSDEPDSDSDGGGGSGRRSPRRPPPVGPVSWQEFERQFAAYVEGRGAPGARDRARTGARDERAPNAA